MHKKKFKKKGGRGVVLGKMHDNLEVNADTYCTSGRLLHQ